MKRIEQEVEITYEFIDNWNPSNGNIDVFLVQQFMDGLKNRKYKKVLNGKTEDEIREIIKVTTFDPRELMGDNPEEIELLNRLKWKCCIKKLIQIDLQVTT